MVYRPPEMSQHRMEVVDRWLLRACTSLLTAWDDDTGNYWRDSWEAEADSAEEDDEEDRRYPSPALAEGKGATSNNRAFQAMVAAAYCLSENADVGRDTPIRADLAARIERMINGYYSLSLVDLRGHGENRQNPYTDAQLLLSLTLALTPVTAQVCGFELVGDVQDVLEEHVRELAIQVARTVDPDGVRVHEHARAHHFLTLHSVRALDAAKRLLEGIDRRAPALLDIERRASYSTLVSRVRDEIVQQLGLHLLPAPGFDSSSLVSCCALMGRFNGDADSPLLQHAVNALVVDQSERGTWTTSGVLSFGRRRLIYIPSIEISLILANLALRDLHEADTDIFERALPALDASLQLVQSSYTAHAGKTGWRNDRTQAGYEVESWTTAVVLQFLIAYRETLTVARQEDILRKYRATRESPRFLSFWADLGGQVPSRERQQVIRSGRLPRGRLNDYSALVDPTENNIIVNGVRDEILQPTLTSLHLRPVETASFLMYGPPGTGKTTFVERLATELRWPILTLTPPMFLRNGIEGFEAAADEIFEDLMHLKRVVVLFDECEEFFRWRPTPTSIESRTVGAFITSGMLPRLQRLRNERWIVFVINTNVEAFELDDAVTRRGRLDKVARVGHPELSAQLRFLQAWNAGGGEVSLSARHLQWFRAHLTRIEKQMGPLRTRLEEERTRNQVDNPDRGQAFRERMAFLQHVSARVLTKVVTFNSLRSLAERCVGEGRQGSIDSSKRLLENLEEEFQRFGPDSFAPSRAWNRTTPPPPINVRELEALLQQEAAWMPAVANARFTDTD